MVIHSISFKMLWVLIWKNRCHCLTEWYLSNINRFHVAFKMRLKFIIYIRIENWIMTQLSILFKISIDNTIGDIFQPYLSFLLPYMTNSTVIRAEKSFGLVEPSGEWRGSLYRPPWWILPTQYYYNKRIINVKYLTTKWLIIMLIYHYFRYSVHYTFFPTKFV